MNDFEADSSKAYLQDAPKGKEETIEKRILEKHKLKSFGKIKQDQIQIVISNKEHDEKLANNIIRTVQSNFDTQMYITVKFQS